MGGQRMASHCTARHILDQYAVGRQDGVVPVLRVRVAASWEVLDADWAEVHVKVNVQDEWVDLTVPGVGMLVARRYSGSGGDVEVPEISIVSIVKKMLGAGGATVLDLSGEECMQVPGHRPRKWFRYWAVLGSRVSVALEPGEFGSVRFVDIM